MIDWSIKDRIVPKYRDEQRWDEQRRRISLAALDVFSRFGYRDATNKKIAEAAGGIAPGLIYHYFLNKQALFRAAIEEVFPLLQMTARPDELLALPLEPALRRIAYGYLAIFQRPEVRSGITVLVSEFARADSELRDQVMSGAFRQVFDMLAMYLRSQIACGALRPINVHVAARAFMGSLAIMMLSRHLLHQPEALAVDDAELVETVVGIFLQGMESS